jgi:UDP-glucose:(heptosyl)LPS alpha-1,3-glucosyltransferase
MKIAIVRRRYDPLGGGAERYSHRLVEGLINKGYSVTVYAEKFSNVPDEVKLVKVPKAFFTLCKTAAFAKKTAKILNRDEYDVVVALSRFLGADIYRQAEQIHKYWLEEIGYVKGYSLNPRHLGILEIERQLFKVENTTQVVTNSNLIKEQIVGLFNYPKDRVNVIYNGLDKSVFYRYKSNKVRMIYYLNSMFQKVLMFCH